MVVHDTRSRVLNEEGSQGKSREQRPKIYMREVLGMVCIMLSRTTELYISDPQITEE